MQYRSASAGPFHARQWASLELVENRAGVGRSLLHLIQRSLACFLSCHTRTPSVYKVRGSCGSVQPILAAYFEEVPCKMLVEAVDKAKMEQRGAG